ncbi:hypothetical protein QJQ45_026384 [Haematococcus lacustris]|nr:hypothetical protein QJQ45_026384 [Haematococcus lacustris]
MGVNGCFAVMDAAGHGSLSPDSSDHLSPLMARRRPHSSPLRHPSPPAAALPPQEALQLQHQFAGRREEPTSRGAHQEVSARLYTAPTSRSRSPTAGTRASANPGDGLSASRPRSARPATQRLSGQPRPRNQSTSSQRPTSSQAAPAVTAQVQGNSGMAARNPAAVGMEGEAVLLAAHLNSQQPLPSSPSGPGAPSPSSPSPQRSTADPRHRLSPTARRRLRAGSRYREQESLRASQERAEAHFHRFRIKQHRDDQPDVRYSQPRSQGPHVVLGQHTYSFDPAHPAMAGQHYLRSQEQEGLLAEERRLAALKQRRRAAQLATPSGSRSPSPVTGPRSMTALQREVARIARARERSREQMQRMQEKHSSSGRHLLSPMRCMFNAALQSLSSHLPGCGAGSALAALPLPLPLVGSAAGLLRLAGGGVAGPALAGHAPGSRLGALGWAHRWQGDAGLAAVSHLVQRRALDAINASEAITRRLAHSPSLSASPPRLRSASPHRPTSSPARPQPGAGLSLAELYGFTGTAGMEAGGPSPPDPYPYREPGGGQASPGQRQAWLEVQYERDNAVQTDPGAGSSSLADYLALSSGVRVAEFVPGTALAEGEMRLAMGGFDAARFEEYNRQMDLEMQQRADQRAYDSDQEREEQVWQLDTAGSALHPMSMLAWVAAAQQLQFLCMGGVPYTTLCSTTPSLPCTYSCSCMTRLMCCMPNVQAAELMSHQALTAEQQATQEQERQDKQDLMALLQQTWEEQDSWMDEYRTRLGPQEGYQGKPQGRRSTQSSPGGQGQQLLGDMRSPSPSRPSHQPLSPSDEALVDGSFMPLLSPGLVAEGYVSDGPDGYVRRPQGGGGGLRPAGRQRPFTPTVPEPMAFEERAAARPKPIRTVKLEQDLAIKQQEEQAARHWRHKARPVPDAVLDQRYQQMLLEAEVRRQINRDTRLAELASMVEQPFSFQERDEQRKMMQEAIAARAKDPNRFQQHFHAKPVPTAVKIEKFKFMQMELEAKRAAARARMEEARALARQRLQQDVDHRQDNAKRASI